MCNKTSIIKHAENLFAFLFHSMILLINDFPSDKVVNAHFCWYIELVSRLICLIKWNRCLIGRTLHCVMNEQSYRTTVHKVCANKSFVCQFDMKKEINFLRWMKHYKSMGEQEKRHRAIVFYTHHWKKVTNFWITSGVYFNSIEMDNKIIITKMLQENFHYPISLLYNFRALHSLQLYTHKHTETFPFS